MLYSTLLYVYVYIYVLYIYTNESLKSYVEQLNKLKNKKRITTIA